MFSINLDESSCGDPRPEDDPIADIEGTKKGVPALSGLVVYCTIPLVGGDIPGTPTPCRDSTPPDIKEFIFIFFCYDMVF